MDGPLGILLTDVSCGGKGQRGDWGTEDESKMCLACLAWQGGDVMAECRTAERESVSSASGQSQPQGTWTEAGCE